MSMLCALVSVPETPVETQQLAARSSSDPYSIGNGDSGSSSSDDSSSSKCIRPQDSHHALQML